MKVRLQSHLDHVAQRHAHSAHQSQIKSLNQSAAAGHVCLLRKERGAPLDMSCMSHGSAMACCKVGQGSGVTRVCCTPGKAPAQEGLSGTLRLWCGLLPVWHGVWGCCMLYLASNTAAPCRACTSCGRVCYHSPLKTSCTDIALLVWLHMQLHCSIAAVTV
jgi:hypothetical protein